MNVPLSFERLRHAMNVLLYKDVRMLKKLIEWLLYNLYFTMKQNWSYPLS